LSHGARAENELSCLEAIHLFVEILDTYFSHVCELDLVWHFHKARALRRVALCCKCAPASDARCARLRSGVHDSGRVHPGGRDSGDQQKGASTAVIA
jgi:hypothetical protein